MTFEREEARVVLKTDGGGGLSTRDLSYFMYHFQAAYVAALDEYKNIASSGERYGNIEAVATKIAQRVHESNNRISFLARRKLDPETDLMLHDVRRENPVITLFSCVLAALVTAVILSGGTIKIGSVLECELPPIGEGIRNLRDSLD